MIGDQPPLSTDEFRKLLRQYARYSLNLKSWLYEDLGSMMGQSPPQWLFEIVYRDAHSPFVYWIRERVGINLDEQPDIDQQEKESLDGIVARYSLTRDGKLLKISVPMSSNQLKELRSKLILHDYEFVENKGLFRPKWEGVKQ